MIRSASYEVHFGLIIRLGCSQKKIHQSKKHCKHSRHLLYHNLPGFSPSQERTLGTRLPRPWHVVGTDLFTWNGDEYLLTCDYYSKFPFMKKIPSGQPTGQTAYRVRDVRIRCTRSRTVKATDSSLNTGAFST